MNFKINDKLLVKERGKRTLRIFPSLKALLDTDPGLREDISLYIFNLNKYMKFTCSSLLPAGI